MSLSEKIRANASADELAGYLNGLSHEVRKSEALGLARGDLGRLYAIAAARPCTIETDFLPAGKGPLEEIIHWGKNSLPLFRDFQKRMCRPSKPTDQPLAYGYNEGSTRGLIGPGYFVAREDEHPDQKVRTVVIDYFLTPPEKAQGWPEIKPTSAGLSRFVYHRTRDWMWKVSDHVSIGRARKNDSWMGAYFVLCRED